MGHHVEVIQHGDQRLWPLLGPFMCSREVHKELGGPIYSNDGVTWFLAVERGDVVGFCATRETTAALWYDYAYVVPNRRGKGVFKRLAKERDKFAKNIQLPRRTAVCEPRWKHYEERGWQIQTVRGSWIYAWKSP